jgi:MYXO-CTERM domain-containing protein
MPSRREPLSSQIVKALVAPVASFAVLRGLHAGWKLVTGAEPPAAPDNKQVPVGQAVAWVALLGATVNTARMIARRYASFLLLARPQRQGLPEPDQIDGQDHPPHQPEVPGLPYLVLVALLVWRRRR